MADEQAPASVPTRQEIALLNRWARVAFAARCVWRVRHLFRQFWPDASEEHIAAVDRAVALTQASAADPATVSWTEVREASHAADAASDDARSGYPLANFVAAAAVNAADAAVAADAGRDAYVFAYVAYAAHAAYASVGGVTEPSAAIASTMRRDFELLKAAAEHEGWTDDTPVPPEFFGPLWPDGEPEEWPEDSDAPEPFEFVLDPGDASQDELQEVLASLSDLHAAHTGYVLRYDIQGSRVMAYAEVES